MIARLARVALLAAWMAPATAVGNGAFPDAQTVLTPADRPAQILLVTNFGVILSEDGGSTWQWSCEREANAFGLLYQRGPEPRRRLFTLASDKLAYSDDGTCSFAVAGGSLVGRVITDFFPDPVDANRVVAVGFADGRYGVLESSDGGKTFGPPIFQSAEGDGIGGVEIALHDASTIYVSMTTAADTHPKLARTRDGGAHWTEADFFAELGPGLLRIISIDPRDENVVLLRWIGADSQAVAITRDGGATASKLLEVQGNLTAFTRLANGTLLVAALVDAGTRTTLRRSRDGGASFEEVAGPPQIRALSQRAGVVYAATDNFGDGYALGRSLDEGETWTGMLSYDTVQAILPCLRADPVCQSTCRALAGQGDMTPGTIWSETVCTANPQPPAKPSGCGCAQAYGGSAHGSTLLVLLIVWWRARQRRRATNTNIAASTRIWPGGGASAGPASRRGGWLSNTRWWPRHRLR